MYDYVQTTVERTLTAAWPLPVWVVILWVLLAATFSAWIYYAERGRNGSALRWFLAFIRFSLLMLVMWMFFGWSWQRYTSELPELVVVLDRSASMSTLDIETARGSISRFQKSLDLLADSRKRSRTAVLQRYQTSWYAVANAVELVDVDWNDVASLGRRLVPDGNESKLGDGLREIIARQAGRNAAAIVFISDGTCTLGSGLAEAAEAARSAAIPIYAVALGQELAPPDVRVSDLILDRDAYLGDRIVVELSVIASDVQAAESTIQLRDQTTGVLLDELRVQLSQANNSQTVHLSFIPQSAGEVQLQIQASPIANEQQLDNNSLVTTVRVQDKVVRALMVFAHPSFEFRFLKSLLERTTQIGSPSTASFDVDVVLQDADAEYVLQDESALRLVPSDTSQLESYDIFILGDASPRLISRRSQQTIYECVTVRGAGCMFIFASQSPTIAYAGWPLVGLLPVTAADEASALPNSNGPFRWQPTSVGRSALPLQLDSSDQTSSSFWKTLPVFHHVTPFSAIKPGAQLLAGAVDTNTGREMPLLITQYAGAGRCAIQATDETFLWTSIGGNDVYHQRYWGQMLRWLSRGKLAATRNSELAVNPISARFGQEVRFRLTLGSAISHAGSVDVSIEGGSRIRETVTLTANAADSRVLTGSIHDLPPGRYRAVPILANEEVAHVNFVVRAPPSEQANLRTDVSAMQQLAARSRGKYYAENESQRLLDDLPAGQTTQLGSLPPQSAWNSPAIAVLFIFLLSTEWILRRRARLV
ncbi:MAG: VWA domain-containing protein [Planctomycetales bacterium]|nr:VWA domain-containing protein [Planctomycetales bacterium]